jgi:hypothetical protein
MSNAAPNLLRRGGEFGEPAVRNHLKISALAAHEDLISASTV